jgi:hypothetical protein
MSIVRSRVTASAPIPRIAHPRPMGENPPSMSTPYIKRAGAVLLAAGLIDGAAATYCLANSIFYPSPLSVFGVVAGVFLLRGSARAALLVRSVASFLLAAIGGTAIAAPLIWPLGLIMTAIRLDPGAFLWPAAPVACAAGLFIWVVRELGRQPVRDAIATAGIRRWDMVLPAQAGAGVVFLAGMLLWLALHGQSAAVATQMALEQMGPGYRYQLTWIGRSSDAQGKSVDGIVTAWNETEIKKIIFHWREK